MKRIRTRYAPSPTGKLHIGGARTALFNYLFAKHHGGDFILRIEDTDVKRNVENAEKSQVDNLKWLGITFDESPEKPNEKYGPYKQTQKIKRYNQIIDELIKKGYAYKAYDTPQEILKQKEAQKLKGIHSFRYNKKWLKISQEEKKKRDKQNKYSIRISLPKNKNYSWEDIVRGKITFNTKDIGDFIIKKEDGYPTYNFAVVIDDHDMEISHVLRGEEHITNTPKQLVLYDLLNWEAPSFGHLTIITNQEGKKLSKRDTNLKQFIEDYKNEKYHPHAIFNFLALLGWTHPQAKEIMTHQELIKSFSVERLSKSSTKFDLNKMNWFSKEYIKNQNEKEIEKKLNLKNKSNEWKKLFINTYKQNAITYKQIQKAFKIYEDKTVKKMKKNDVVKEFSKLINKYDFTLENIQEAINKTKKITNKKGKDLFMSIRLITTYQDHGPELAKSIYLFGKDLILKRIK